MPRRTFVHDYDFDPAYGMDLEQLLKVVPPVSPPDFDDFWQRRYEATLQLDPNPHMRASNQILGNHVVHELHYESTDGVTIGGWLLLPQTDTVRRGVLVGHGYGGRIGPDMPFGLEDAVVLFPCFRGMGLSPVRGLSSQAAFHVVHEIQSRDHYILGGCVEDLWMGVSALLDLFPGVVVSYLGSSFGGGIGALAAPWDRRIRRLCLEVPTFGQQALRLTLPCIGSGDAVREYQRHHGFNVMETLSYHDSATAASKLRIPTLLAAALFDPVVPPPGQFAIYNALLESWRRLFLLPAGHFDYVGREGWDRQWKYEVANFLAEP